MMTLTQDEIVQDMRKRCRLAMDGMKSSSMRIHGLNYKLNFGLVIQQIREISERYAPDIELAERLWKEETRELIILATFLYPRDLFTAEAANRWASSIRNQEIREQVCLNLFQELDFADQLSIEWANDKNEEMRTNGYWLLARMLLAKKFDGILENTFFNEVWTDIVSENTFLRNSAQLVLKHIGRQSKEDANDVLTKASIYKDSPDPVKQEAYNNLAFEFDFIFGL